MPFARTMTVASAATNSSSLCEPLLTVSGRFAFQGSRSSCEGRDPSRTSRFPVTVRFRESYAVRLEGSSWAASGRVRFETSGVHRRVSGSP